MTPPDGTLWSHFRDTVVLLGGCGVGYEVEILVTVCVPLGVTLLKSLEKLDTKLPRASQRPAGTSLAQGLCKQ